MKHRTKATNVGPDSPRNEASPTLGDLPLGGFSCTSRLFLRRSSVSRAPGGPPSPSHPCTVCPPTPRSSSRPKTRQGNTLKPLVRPTLCVNKPRTIHFKITAGCRIKLQYVSLIQRRRQDVESNFNTSHQYREKSRVPNEIPIRINNTMKKTRCKIKLE